jgi:isobutyryl-CoA mutase
MTSVSMTINGPAPAILAMFLNTAIDQRARSVPRSARPSEPDADEYGDPAGEGARAMCAAPCRPTSSRRTRARTPASSRPSSPCDDGRCAVSWFIENKVRNFYSVSISGYHIAEAGANPISQLAFTLANGFTFVEAYLARGMKIDDFAPNLSFFFSNGMDPEYTVIGRVARRIWAIAIRERYGANDRSQKLKYHIQTSRPFACTPRRWRSTTSAPRCKRCARSTTTATRCTPTRTTKPSRPRARSRCAAHSRSR